MKITIEELDTANVVSHHDNTIELDDGTEWIIFESTEAAGKAAREHWADMAENDPKEFACMVGENTLIQWGMGRSAGPGSTHVNSLQEWLDLWLDTPEEHFSGYDGQSRNVTFSDKELQEALGFIPVVAYRNN